MRLIRENLFTIVMVVVIAGGFYFFFIRRPARTLTAADGEDEYRLVTLLPRDAIPAIDNPRFYGPDEADREYAPDELVLGVALDGEARAYSTSLLNQHEIVNDTIAGRPIAVTW